MLLFKRDLGKVFLGRKPWDWESEKKYDKTWKWATEVWINLDKKKTKEQALQNFTFTAQCSMITEMKTPYPHAENVSKQWLFTWKINLPCRYLYLAIDAFYRIEH